MSTTTLWQHPYVNVFKSVRVGDWKNAAKKGDASFVMNNSVRSYVVRVRGQVAASNHVTIPPARNGSLNLHGRFAYIQLRALPPRVWSLHIEINTTDKQVYRFSFGPSSVFKEVHTRGHSVRIPVRLSKKWTTLALDLPALLAQHAGGPGVKADHFLSLKRIQICANLDVRNVFTSDEIYRMDNEAKPMIMPVPKGSSWNQEYRWTWLPEPPLPPDAEEIAAALKNNASSSTAKATKGKGKGRIKGKGKGKSKNISSGKERRHFSESSILRGGAASTTSTSPPTSKASSSSPSNSLLINEHSMEETNIGTNNALARASKVLERMGKASSGSRQTTPAARTPIASKRSTMRNSSGKSLRGTIGSARRISEDDMAQSRAASMTAASRILSSVGLEDTKEGEMKSEAWPSNDGDASSLNQSVALRQGDLDASAVNSSTTAAGDAASDATSGDATATTAAVGASRTMAAPPAPQATTSSSLSSIPLPLRPSTLRPDPIMNLEAVIGYSGDKPNNVLWSADASIIVFPSNSIIVLMENTGNDDGEPKSIPRQELLFGHTDDVCALALSQGGGLLASAQQGKYPMIRLWRLERYGVGLGNGSPIKAHCVTILTAHASDLQTMDFSSDDRRLCVVGRDQHRRVQLIVWDVTRASVGSSSKSPTSGAPDPIVARQISEFPIERIKFSPYHPDRLVSCGRENIRFWRIRNGHLRGCPVILNEYARDTVFTDVAFESAYGPRAIDVDGGVQKRVFVSTSRGTVVQINYDTRKVECVYRLHDNAIRSLAINEGYCVTGSDDTFLRVWPLDFSDYILEAQHEGPVLSVNVSQDGLKLAVGTSNGTVGVLDIATHAYKNLLRSHADTIYALAIDPSPERFNFATVAGDRTIRVWSLETLEQLYEFDSSAEQSRALAFQPPSSKGESPHVLACGFDSGCVRIFQVPTTEMSHEYQQHRGPVLQILYSPDGRHMYSAGEDGHICVYDVQRGYQPVKMVASDTCSERVAMAISPDGQYLASVGPDARTTIVFQAESLMPVRKIRRTRRIGSLSLGDDRKYSNFHSVSFSADSRQLVATTDDGRLVRYDAASGDMIRETPAGLHRGPSSGIIGDSRPKGTPLDALQISPNGRFIVTGGADRLIKVWEYGLYGPSLPAFQSFVGHSAKVLQMHFVHRGDVTRVISIGEGNGIYVWRFHGNAIEDVPTEVPTTKVARNRQSETKRSNNVSNVSNVSTSSDVTNTSIDVSEIPASSFESASFSSFKTEESGRAATVVASRGEGSPTRSSSGVAVLSDGTAYKAEQPALDGALAALVQTIRRRGRLLSTTIAQVSKQLAAHDASRDGTISVQDFVRTLGQFNFGIHPSSLQVIVNGILTDEPNRVGYQTFVSEIKRISSVAAHAPDKFQKLQNEALRRSGLELSTGNNGGNSGDGKNSESRYERMMAEGLSSVTAASNTGQSGDPPELELGTILGYGGPGSGNSRNNVVWHPDTGLFGFSCGTIVVLEDLVQENNLESNNGNTGTETPSRQQTHMYGPTNDITVLCSSPDGHLIAAAEGATSDTEDNKGRIWVWDARGRELHRIEHQLGSLQALEFGPYGKFLVAVGSYSTGQVVVWNMFDSSQPCASSSVGPGAPPIHAVDMLSSSGGKDSTDSNTSGDHTVLSFVACGGRTLTQWKLITSSTSGAMQLVCNRVLEAVAGDSGPSHQAEYFTTVAHCNPSPNTYRFAVGGGGGSVWLVTGVIDNGNMSVRMDGHWSALDGGLDYISWREAGDSTSLVVAGVSHLMQTWTVGPHKAKSTQQPTKLGEWQLDGHVLSMIVDTRARDAVVATDSGTIWYVSNTTGHSLSTSSHDGAPIPLVRSHTSPIEDISCAADGTLMATAGGIDGTIRIWHLELLQTALTLDCARCTALTFPAPCVAPMGGQGMHPHVLAAGDASGTVTYFDLAQVVPALPGAVGDRVAARRVRAHGSAVTAMSYIGCTATDTSTQRVLLVSGSATGDIVVTGPCAGDATSVTLDSPHAGSLIQSIEVCPFDPTTWLIASRNSGLSVWRCEPKQTNKTDDNGDAEDNDDNDDNDNSSQTSDFVCTQLTYVLLRKLVEGSSPFDSTSSSSDSASMTSARETVAQKCPTLATFSPCESSVILCTTAAHPFVVLFYNYAIRQVVRTVPLPQWQWATSLSATVTIGRRALIVAGLRSGRLALIDYRNGQTSEFDEALQGTPVGALGFCQPQSILCAASNNVVHVWKTA